MDPAPPAPSAISLAVAPAATSNLKSLPEAESSKAEATGDRNVQVEPSMPKPADDMVEDVVRAPRADCQLLPHTPCVLKTLP
jgi:hypothetical protein